MSLIFPFSIYFNTQYYENIEVYYSRAQNETMEFCPITSGFSAG